MTTVTSVVTIEIGQRAFGIFPKGCADITYDLNSVWLYTDEVVK